MPEVVDGVEAVQVEGTSEPLLWFVAASHTMELCEAAWNSAIVLEHAWFEAVLAWLEVVCDMGTHQSMLSVEQRQLVVRGLIHIGQSRIVMVAVAVGEKRRLVWQMMMVLVVTWLQVEWQMAL